MYSKRKVLLVAAVVAAIVAGPGGRGDDLVQRPDW